MNRRVSYEVSLIGKRYPSSKRRVTFVLRLGDAGCESNLIFVTLRWSVNSQKTLLSVNGKVIDKGEGEGNRSLIGGIYEHAWEGEGREFVLRGHRTIPRSGPSELVVLLE